MNQTPPPHPVIIDSQGFKMFAHANGRYSTAVKVGNVRVYARDYQAGALPVDDGLVEPGEVEFVAALMRQGAVVSKMEIARTRT